MFKIGERVVCVKTHPNGACIEGNIYKILSIRKGNCKCCEMEVHIGLMNYTWTGIAPMITCPACGTRRPNTPEHAFWWLDSKRFAPLQTTYTESEIESVDISEITQEEVITA
jgi:hypothetical protein